MQSTTFIYTFSNCKLIIIFVSWETLVAQAKLVLFLNLRKDKEIFLILSLYTAKAI